MIDTLKNDAIELLKDLIQMPSFSGEEQGTAQHINSWLLAHGIETKQSQNNVWAVNKHYDASKPNILLNSHHDTVKPNKAYTRDPFEALVEDGKLYGLGSNDAGASLVSLMSAFVHYYEAEDLKYNLILLASGEEENSGPNGIASMLPQMPTIDVAIVGEPTQMHLAIAEKGLLVFDAVVKGTPGHVAHENNDQAIYKCVEVLDWFRTYTFDKVSETLGPVKMTVSQINAGSQHNVVPAEVNLVVDVRVNDCYSNEEVVELLQTQAPVDSIEPRSIRLNSSSIPADHPLVKAGLAMGRDTYGSPTISDQALLICPSLKMGPGDSKRSHSADEYVLLEEIEQGIEIYIELLNQVL